MNSRNRCHPIASDLDRILEHTEDLWGDLRGQRLFITGGTGFFGQWLLESFAWINDRLNLKASMTVLTRNHAAFTAKAPRLATYPSISFHCGDVKSFTFPEEEFSHVIHAATDTDARMNEKEPLLMFDTISEGTRHTLDFAVHCGARKFLLTSSGAVYGKQPSDMTHIPEGYQGAPDPTDSNSAYGEGKRTAELLCTLYSQAHNIETKIARCFAFVGPYQPLNVHFAIGNFIQDGLGGGPIVVKSDGTPYRSYLYAADLAIWLWTILFTGTSCRPYNVGSEDAVAIKELAHIVAECFRNHISVKIDKSPVLTNPPSRYVPLTKLAREELGVRQTLDLRESVKLTIASCHGCK